MGLLQRDVADQIGVTPFTILNWEKGRTTPSISAFPGIFRFLGYDPFPLSGSLSEFLLAKRRKMGWSIEQAAQAIGVDPSSWGNWERGRAISYRHHREIVARLLDLPIEVLQSMMILQLGPEYERSNGAIGARLKRSENH